MVVQQKQVKISSNIWYTPTSKLNSKFKHIIVNDHEKPTFENMLGAKGLYSQTEATQRRLPFSLGSLANLWRIGPDDTNWRASPPPRLLPLNRSVNE